MPTFYFPESKEGYVDNYGFSRSILYALDPNVALYLVLNFN